MSTPDDIEWRISHAAVDYQSAVLEMERRVDRVIRGEAPELVWLLEHPPLYTAGSSARDEDLLDSERFPVYRTGRGGQYTYHGPGQRIAYVMLDLNRRRRDVREFVRDLESWVIAALAAFNVNGERRAERIGIWVERNSAAKDDQRREDKIAAIGVRIRRWVSFHGLAINVDPNLEHFSGIVPCGVGDERFGVTSLVDLGLPVTMSDVDLALMESFEAVFQRRLKRVA